MTQLPENKRVDRKIHQLEKLVRQQGAAFPWLTSIMEFLMASQQDLLDKIAELKKAIADDQTSDQTIVNTLDAKIAELTAAGDTSGAIAALEEARASITSVSSPNNA